jgi:hypothetical protein
MNRDKTFNYVDHLKLHMENNQVGNSVREVDNGGAGGIVRNPSITSGGRLL